MAPSRNRDRPQPHQLLRRSRHHSRWLCAPAERAPRPLPHPMSRSPLGEQYSNVTGSPVPGPVQTADVAARALGSSSIIAVHAARGVTLMRKTCGCSAGLTICSPQNGNTDVSTSSAQRRRAETGRSPVRGRSCCQRESTYEDPRRTDPWLTAAFPASPRSSISSLHPAHAPFRTKPPGFAVGAAIARRRSALRESSRCRNMADPRCADPLLRAAGLPGIARRREAPSPHPTSCLVPPAPSSSSRRSGRSGRAARWSRGAAW